jgi:UDP-2-acetamido-2,6-beta-L-arabino-hexul-4-ose reductase
MTTPLWKSPYTIREIEKRSDPRGSLVEFIRFEDHGVPQGGQIYAFTMVSGATRGKHYHLSKQEWFCCIHGNVEIQLHDREGKLLEKCVIGGSRPAVIYAAPGTAHTLVNHGKETATVVAYSSEQFHANDPDTFRLGE